MNIRTAWDRTKGNPRRIIVLFAALGIISIAVIIPKAKENGEGWPTSRFNELQGEKMPPVLYLAGKFSEVWKSYPGSPRPKSGEFEMCVRGTNYYFLKCWHGNPTNRPGPFIGLLSEFLPFVGRRYSGWFEVQIAIDDFSWQMGRRWGRFGSQGGGGSGGDLVPGRRLWNQSGFVGALEEGQVNQEWYAKEVLRDLKKVGKYRVPQIIEFSRGDCTQTYQIQKCEFRDEPTPEWFRARKKEFYGRDDETPVQTQTNSPLTK
ncbi:MAG: hypothetical protein HZA89_14755 [Verrucomicrobia bacterium]|nr:hypothetical protein [Verrucomicrobiota bacterium]